MSLIPRRASLARNDKIEIFLTFYEVVMFWHYPHFKREGFSAAAKPFFKSHITGEVH
jgi:hypothetical protein